MNTICLSHVCHMSFSHMTISIKVQVKFYNSFYTMCLYKRATPFSLPRVLFLIICRCIILMKLTRLEEWNHGLLYILAMHNMNGAIFLVSFPGRLKKERKKRSTRFFPEAALGWAVSKNLYFRLLWFWLAPLGVC